MDEQRAPWPAPGDLWAQAYYHGLLRVPGMLILDAQGYDRALAKQSVGPGWHVLIDRFFDAVPEGIRVVQVKEKVGRLRMYVATGAPETLERLSAALEAESAQLCEQCGAPGLLRDGLHVQTLCDEHSAALPPFRR